jgi:dihydrofolate synthase/folylpolyglutamate synthase
VPVAAERLTRTLSSVILPGRWSWHAVPGSPAWLFADSAINRAGVAAALTEVYRRWDRVDRVLACFPDHKDVAGAIAELCDLPVTYVRLRHMPWLRFSHPIPEAWATVDAARIDRAFVAARGPRIVAVGTAYFIGHMLEVADVDTRCLFTVPAPEPAAEPAARARS